LFRMIKQDEERLLQAVYLVLLYCERSISDDYSTYEIQIEQKDNQTTLLIKVPSEDQKDEYLPSKHTEIFHPID
jgi:Tfp pilus assembly protein PilP